MSDRGKCAPSARASSRQGAKHGQPRSNHNARRRTPTAARGRIGTALGNKRGRAPRPQRDISASPTRIAAPAARVSPTSSACSASGSGWRRCSRPRRCRSSAASSNAEGNAPVMRAIGAREISNGIAILSQPAAGEGALVTRRRRRARPRAARQGDGEPGEQPRSHAVRDGQRARRDRTRRHGREQLSMQPRHDRERAAPTRGSSAPSAASRSTGRSRRSTRFWHNFENLPRFMRHLESVTVIGERRSHWKAKAPAGKTVEWDAETTEDRPNELIAWRSTAGADVDNAGTVRFEPRARRSRHRGARRDGVQAAARQARLQGRDALRRGAGAAGDGRPAPLQAGDGDRRDRASPTRRSSAGCTRRSRTTSRCSSDSRSDSSAARSAAAATHPRRIR